MRRALISAFILLCMYSSTVAQGFRIADLTWANDVGARTEPTKGKIYNVSSYGAVADGTTLSTKSIQEAIDDCSHNGGGTVTFSPGNYLTGSLYLKEGVHLEIPEGVTISGSTNIEDYPDIFTRVAGIEMEWPSALINVIGQKNVTITGKGSVDGQGKPFWDAYWKMRKDYEAKGLRWIVDYDCKRPRTLLISESEDVTVRNITLKRAGFWTIHILYSNHCTVDGVIIRNNIGGHGPSTDGIDIDSSSHILVENCDIDCNDDNFCLKAGRDADGLRVNRPTEYVVIRNCVSRAGGGLFTCGSETSGGIRYVLAHNLKAKGTTVGLRFKSAMNRGGTTKHIYIKDIEMDGVGTAIEATMNWNPAYSYSTLPEEYEGKELPDHWKKMLQTVDPPEKAIPYFNNIHLTDIRATNAKKAFNVEGSKSSKMEYFYLDDIHINSQRAGSIQHASKWRVNNVIIDADDKQTLDISDSENLPFLQNEKPDVSFPYKLKESNDRTIVAAKHPEVAFLLPDMAGNLSFGIRRNDNSKWIKEAQLVDIEEKNNMLTYKISDPLLEGGEITFSIIALSQTDGVVIRVIGKRLPRDTQLFWSFGGGYGKILSSEDAPTLLPLYCPNNVFSVEQTAFTMYYGESMRLRVIQGVTPITSEIRLSDAHKQETPLSFFESGKKTKAPALAAMLPMENGKAEYFCIYRQNRNADYNHFMLPELFEQEIRLATQNKENR